MKLLEDYTYGELAEKAKQLGRAYTLFIDDLRKECFERRSHEMLTDPVVEWAEVMEKRFGPKVRVWRNDLSWPAALGVVGHGEDPDSWPERFTDLDELRAQRWAAGLSVPNGVKTL